MGWWGGKEEDLFCSRLIDVNDAFIWANIKSELLYWQVCYPGGLSKSPWEVRGGGTFSSAFFIFVEPPCDCFIHCRKLCSVFATVGHKLSPGHPNLSAPIYLWDYTVVTIALHLSYAGMLQYFASVCYNIFFNGYFKVSWFWGSKVCFNYYFNFFFVLHLWGGFLLCFQPLSPVPICLSSASILLPACGLKRTYLIVILSAGC